MVAFLKDPSGPPLWEENPEAKDVVHIETERVSTNSHKLKFLVNYEILCTIKEIETINVDMQLVITKSS